MAALSFFQNFLETDLTHIHIGTEFSRAPASFIFAPPSLAASVLIDQSANSSLAHLEEEEREKELFFCARALFDRARLIENFKFHAMDFSFFRLTRNDNGERGGRVENDRCQKEVERINKVCVCAPVLTCVCASAHFDADKI